MKLGDLFKNGESVSRDEATAFKWYLHAAKRGQALGQYCVGTMLNHGQGVHRDPEKALLWFRRAGEQGHLLALGALRKWGQVKV